MYQGAHAEPKKSSFIRSLISLVILVVAVVVLTLLLRTYVVHPYEIPSSSMESTIMPGDYVFSEKVSGYFSDPQPGDIVTFSDPLTASLPEDDQRTLIKRVIATEGQTVDLIDGVVVVDGEPLDEAYTNGRPSLPSTVTAKGVEITYPYTVGEGELWVMGDNRTNSQDSRYFGAIDVSSVTGKAFLTFWPFNRFGLLNSGS